MAELADALDSGSSECKFMWVQVPSSAPGNSEYAYAYSLFLFADRDLNRRPERFREAKTQYGQKHSRLARLERVAILLVSSCSTTLLHLPQAAQFREPSPVVRITKSRCPHGGNPVVANTIYSLLFFCTLLNLAFYPRNW